MLAVENLRVNYGTVSALSGVSLRVESREFVSVIGSNGAGKTSLLKAISGSVASRAESITFNGVELRGMRASRIAKLGIAHVPEGRKVFKEMSVEENLLMGAMGHTDWKMRLEAQYELFPRLGERRAQLAGTLSGGEQQMLAIGRGLMSAPKLLMLDEPSLGLAPNLSDSIFAHIQDVYRKSDMAVLLVEQQAAEALEISDRTYVIESGRVSIEGPSSQLATDDAIRQAYLGVW
ncbi:MAG: ABC transporter ATP-binding protein [Candidatus Velthaea sp.]